MDEELYQILMGEMPKSGEMSKALRRQHSLGQIGMITGDKAIAPAGAKMFEDAGNQAWRETQADQTKRAALARALEAERERKWQEEQNRLNRANQLAAAGIRAKKSGRSFGVRDIERLGTMSEEAENISNVANQFKDEYAGTGLPGGRAAANWVAANIPMLAPKSAEEAQEWWARWDRTYTLKERNRMFGSALTETEKKAWDQANISPNMSADQIRSNVNTINSLKAKAIRRLKDKYVAAGFDPDEVDAVLGADLDEEGEFDSGGFKVGTIVTGDNGRQYRIVGGDPNDPDVEPVE